MRKLKLYLETSVWNFYYASDAPEKRDITKKFFEEIKSGKYDIYEPVAQIPICHPELVSGSRNSLILLDAETSSA